MPFAKGSVWGFGYLLCGATQQNVWSTQANRVVPSIVFFSGLLQIRTTLNIYLHRRWHLGGNCTFV